jgi:para-nitrobenzyl esterase
METMRIDSGIIKGMVIGEPGKELHVYRGIPYAAPPVHELRWKPPQPVRPWPGVRDCTAFSPFPPQGTLIPPDAPPRTNASPPPRPEMPQSEDCLYLNVLTPARNPTERLPVMVWLHGGGFAMGSGNEALCNFHRLPQHGVVLVTVNGRLGPLGLLAHPALTAESPNIASGNYLFLDLIAALQWVQRNIASFGGNPDNVTIFGESGGGAKVLSLMASPLAKGLFHKVIAESGSPDGKPLTELETVGEQFFTRLGIAGEKNPLAEVRAMPWERIIETDAEMVYERNIVGRGGLWDLAVDGWFVEEFPLDLFRVGKYHALPMILLANLGELTTKAGAYLLPHYTVELLGAVKTGVPARAVVFDQLPGSWRAEGCFSFHALELGYVFGDWDDTTGFWNSIYSMAGPAGAKSRDPGLSETDRRVSELMMRMWTQFARTGSPDGNDIPFVWPAWDEPEEKFLYINEDARVLSGFSRVTEPGTIHPGS